MTEATFEVTITQVLLGASNSDVEWWDFKKLQQYEKRYLNEYGRGKILVKYLLELKSNLTQKKNVVIANDFNHTPKKLLSNCSQ